MKIEDVLKDEDKAVPIYQEQNRFSNVYASLDDSGVLWWHSMESDKRLEPVPLNTINEKEWGAYHEVKEIRPEKEGELWKLDEEYYHTEDHTSSGCGLCLVGYGSKGFKEVDNGKTAHNKNGWTRLYPPVEDDSVERIDIEGVRWYQNRDKCIVPEIDNNIADSLLDRPPMKMILEYAKG